MTIFSMPFKEMKDEIVSRLEDVSFDNFEETEVGIWVNLGVQDVVTKTNCLQSSATADVNSGQREYTQPDDCFRITRVTYNGKRIGCTNFEELDTDNVNWEDETGTPTNYIKYKNEIWLYPMPNADLTAGLKVFYDEMVEKMTADDDVPFNDRKQLYPYHELPILFALHRAYQKDEKFTPNAQAIMGEYVVRIRLMRGELSPPDEPLRMRGGRNY